MRRVARLGYTLVELMVVMSILGIAGALLVPQLVNSDTFSVQAATRAIISDLTFAQNDAWANQEIRRFQFLRSETGDIRGYAILAPPTAYDAPFDPETATYLDHPSLVGTGGSFTVNFDDDARFSDVVIASVNFDGRDWIAYDGLGGPIGPSLVPFTTGGGIEVRGQSGAYLIHLSGFTGKISLQRIDE